MPKLITKQDVPPPSRQQKLLNLLQIILPIVLALIAVIAIYIFYFSSDAKPVAIEAPPPKTSSVEPQDKEFPTVSVSANYDKEKLSFEQAQALFNKTLATGEETYAKNSHLVTQANVVLQHLLQMETLAETDAKLKAADQQNLKQYHQYWRDFWETKLAFHRLRLARFEEKPVEQKTAPEGSDVTNKNDSKPEQDKADTNKKLVQTETMETPSGKNLPSDFCPLRGPGADACKANRHK